MDSFFTGLLLIKRIFKCKTRDQIEQEIIQYFKEKQALEDRNVKWKEKPFKSIATAIIKGED